MTLDAILLYDISERDGNDGNQFGIPTLARIEKVALRHRPNVVLLDEFRGSSHFIMENWQRLSSISRRSGSDIVLAPAHYWPSQEKPWNGFARELKNRGVQVEEVDEPKSPDSVGFFFGHDGLVYAFPKQWERTPVHRIPGRDIGVTICGEINHVKPEMLNGIALLLNPSLEHDDPTMSVRDMIAAGMTIEDAFEHFRSGIDRDAVLQMVAHPSPYAKHIYGELQRRGILALRSDGGLNSSGILSLPPGASISEYSFTCQNYESTMIGYSDGMLPKWQVTALKSSNGLEMNRIMPMPFGFGLVNLLRGNHTPVLHYVEQYLRARYGVFWLSEFLHLPRGWSLARRVERPTDYTYLRIENLRQQRI